MRFRSTQRWEFLPKEQCPNVLLLYISLLHDINDIVVLSYGLHIMCNFFILFSVEPHWTRPNTKHVVSGNAPSQTLPESPDRLTRNSKILSTRKDWFTMRLWALKFHRCTPKVTFSWPHIPKRNAVLFPFLDRTKTQTFIKYSKRTINNRCYY